MIASLVGTRVTLRPYAAGLSDDELRALYRWSCDPELLRLSGGVPINLPFARFRELFLAQASVRNGPREQHFVILDEVDTLIGRAGLFGLVHGTGAAELGIVIGERVRWGRGYGREAVTLLATFGFEQLGLERIILRTFPDNDRARRAFAASGFRVVGERRQFSLDRGSHSTLEMVISRDAPPPPRSDLGDALQRGQERSPDRRDDPVSPD